MELGLEGRRALVTGASSGLGLAVAAALAAEGADVVISSRSAENLEAALPEVKGAGAVHAIAADMAKAADVHHLVEETRAALGGIDIAVANAGGPPPGRPESFADADFAAALELNLMSTVRLCQAVVGDMRRQRWGRIVGITSIAVRQPLPDLILSSTARAGATAYLKTLARAVAADGVTVNTVQPGLTATERLERLATARAGASGDREAVISAMAASVPAGRLGTPSEFAAAAVFLCSAPASYITGVHLQVDGGLYQGLL
jgi:3-oxoacyl-[acyl-carrier protein] reductase